jgi:NitT/TauT family transport system substrate-binding protein
MLNRVIYGMPTGRSAPSVQFGMARGCFRDEGIELSVRAFYGGPALAAALQSGELAFGHLGTPPALVALSQGARFRVVGSGIKKKAHLYLGLRADLESVAALRGRKIGLLSMGSCDEWIAARMLQCHGLRAGADVELVALHERYERVVELIAERRIDGALAIEPSMSVGEAKGLLRIWAAAYDEPYLPIFQWTVLAASEPLVAERPELLRALLRGYIRSSQAVRDNPEEYAAFIAELFGLPPAAARRSVHREHCHYEFDGRVDRVGLERAIELQSSLDALARPVTIEDFLDTRYLPT